jgi:hypothetical protein
MIHPPFFLKRYMPPKKRQRSKRSPRKKVHGPQLKVLLASLFLIAFLLVSLLLLSYLRHSWQAKPTPTVDVGQFALEDLRVELESALLRSGISLEQIKIGEENGIATFDVNRPFPPEAVVDSLSERVRRVAPEAHIDTGINPRTIAVYLEGRIVYLLWFAPAAVEPPSSQAPLLSPVRGRMAIIMDDLGQDLHSARTLLAIDLAITFAIIPKNGQARQVATLAHQHGREVLVHIPMEPKGYPAMNPGSDALFLKLPAEDIRRRLQGYLQQVPYAVGGNNHMGSRFTQSREQMAVVIEELRKAGMFFVDSRTSGESVAYQVARQAGVPAATRDLFLDNVQNEEAIAREIRKLVKMAIKTGQAVGICHPYPQTLAALRREAEYIRSQGVEVVPVSQLLVR